MPVVQTSGRGICEPYFRASVLAGSSGIGTVRNQRQSSTSYRLLMPPASTNGRPNAIDWLTPARRWTHRPHRVARGVRHRGRGGALVGVDERHDVCLARGHVHLRQRDPGEQQRDRGREVGGERDHGEEHVRRQVGEHHRAQDPEPLGQSWRGQKRRCLQQPDREEHDAEHADRRVELRRQPVRDEGLHDEAPAEAVEREQSGETQDRRP